MTDLLVTAVLYVLGGLVVFVVLFGLVLVFGERASDIARRDR